ncbi:hypothetical protein ABW20_dc0100660 [Dactylellina cionopaga]|nr:hypothetical protein ABW20_dc0100660 [Dactylellina cionopaga]
MATIALPDIILSPRLNQNKPLYVDAHTVSLIDPKNPNPNPNERIHLPTRMSFLHSIAVLLTTQPGESVAVSVRLYGKHTIVYFARANKSVVSAQATGSQVGDLYPTKLLAGVTGLSKDFELRHQTTRMMAYDTMMKIVIDGCKHKILRRVKKLQEAIIGGGINGKRRMLDGIDGNAKAEDAVFHLYHLRHMDGWMEDFEGFLRERVGHDPGDRNWDVFDWLQAFGEHIIQFDINGPKVLKRKRDDKDKQDDTGEKKKTPEEKKYYRDLSDMVTACATLLKAKHVDAVIKDLKIWKRIIKIAEYAVATMKILEAVDKRRAEFVLLEVPFTFHPEIVLAVYLASPSKRLRKGREILRIATSMKTCCWCEEWLGAFAEHTNVIVAFPPHSLSKKKGSGWRAPEYTGELAEVVELASGHLGLDAFSKVREILRKIWKEPYIQEGGFILKVSPTSSVAGELGDPENLDVSMPK